jgi:hypothetical protein
MSESSQLQRTFQIIMKQMMETGQAPHYTEIAAQLGVPVEEGRKLLHELFIGCFLIPTISAHFRRSTTFPPNTVSLLMVNRSGSPNEDLKRWRSAGFSQEN